MSMWVHKFFKRMISSSRFVAIARLVVLARKDPRTTSPFSSHLDPVTLTCTLFSLQAFLRKMNIRKESSIGTCPAQQVCYELQGKSLTLTEHSRSVFVTVTVSVNVRFKINIKRFLLNIRLFLNKEISALP